MSALKEKIDSMFGRPTAKIERPPVAPPSPAPPPSAFLSANIKPETKEFLIVFGDYNFAVAKSFAQPVIGLLNDWVPAYIDMHPFAGMTKAEIVISRVVPQLPAGSADANPEATKCAVASANNDTNIRMLISLARHAW